MCNDKTPADNWETGANPCLIENKSQNGMWGISPTVAQKLANSSTES